MGARATQTPVPCNAPPPSIVTCRPTRLALNDAPDPKEDQKPKSNPAQTVLVAGIPNTADPPLIAEQSKENRSVKPLAINGKLVFLSLVLALLALCLPKSAWGGPGNRKTSSADEPKKAGWR